MDRLAALLEHVHLHARVFNSGPLCDSARYEGQAGLGHIHLLKAGSLRLVTEGEPERRLDEPSLIFFLRPRSHSLIPGPGGAETVCGDFSFGSARNPLSMALARPLILPLDSLAPLSRTLELLFDEALVERCGRQAALDRLCELLIIQLLRHLMDRDEIDVGLLAGLADPRLARALIAIHEDPAAPWTLAQLASTAGMSRARFALAFRETLGQTAGDYLAQWRLCLAQTLLREGRPIDWVANRVGYSGAPALAKRFRQSCGLSPTQWLKQS
ncbi:AraC family transcriptional regulator [Marinobacterium nitratireducens]|uniref:AraC family transcriptional regulator n=1 Tax=Marinobacterium nitratireducens TaxID=518897 RepID=A0A918DS87_9GAMM|nr:AraC family transcriptional regulator [Marinobacterium nitratireducens]GGO81401.1 AraC family transcriptional regulator [Marinobacterium nitratireducens]